MRAYHETSGPKHISEAVESGPASPFFQHVLIYRLLRRWMYLQGLDPAEIQEGMELQSDGHVIAFHRLSREACGREIDMRFAKTPELLKMRALMRDRVGTLQKTPRAIENEWYPDNWRAAMGGTDAANEGATR